MTKSKKLLFGVMAAGLPVVLLLLLEGVLQLLRVGPAGAPAFTAVPGAERYRALNPGYVRRYFRGFVPGVAFNPFEEERGEGTYRVFVLGESSVAGFPYSFYYGFPARLEVRLAAALPGRRVEVVNLGMTAVNSYTLWDLRGAVAAQRPDAVLVYTGHNEYYGAFGVGSTIGALGDAVALKRLTLRLKHSVLFSLLERLVAGAPTLDPQNRTMMAQVVRDAGIPLGGDVYRAGLAQLEANLSDVLATFAGAGIPVYLATLASNLRDQPPLGDEPAAAAAYRRGQEALARGDTVGARAAFVEAREHDGIRFRAPEGVNALLRRLAERPGVVLVDVEQRFRAASPSGIEGNTLFDDHLHPNAWGYDLMAQAFFEAMRPSLPGALDVPPPPPVRVDPFERAQVYLSLARLKMGFPFVKGGTPGAEAAAYEALLHQARSAGYADSLAVEALTGRTDPPHALLAAAGRAQAAHDTLAVLLYHRALGYWQPFNTALTERGLGYALAAPAYDALTAELALLAATRTPQLFPLNALAAVRLRQGRLAEADTLLRRAEALDATSPVMLYNRARLLVLQGDTTGARRYFDRYRAAR